MPFKNSPPIDFSSIGLITDQPTHSLAEGAWSESLNVRAKDGSVEGVNSFADSFASTISGEPYAVTQWTPTGSNDLFIAYILKDTSDIGRVFVYDTTSAATVEITNLVVVGSANASFTLDDEFPPQIFVFNDNLIVNPATGTPQHMTVAAIETKISTGSGTSLVDLPNWVTYAGGVKAIARVIRPFKNRLVAMSLLDDKDTSTDTDDEAYSIDFLWSTNISVVGSLDAMQWVAATTNDSGDAFLTQSPGKIIDGGELGDVFIAYKSDAVIRMSASGDAVYPFSFESIAEDDGIFSTRCFANIGNQQHLVIGNYGVYLLDSNGQKKHIAKGIFQDTMYGLIKASEKERAFAFQQTRDKEVWFCFSSSANSGAGCDRAYVWDYEGQKLHYRSLPNITDIQETEFEGVLKIYAAAPGDNSIQLLSNTILEPDGYFLRKASDAGDPTVVKAITGVHIASEGKLKIAVMGSFNITDTISYISLGFDPATQYKVDGRTTGRYLNIKMTMDGAINPKLTTIRFNMKPKSAR